MSTQPLDRRIYTRIYAMHQAAVRHFLSGSVFRSRITRPLPGRPDTTQTFVRMGCDGLTFNDYLAGYCDYLGEPLRRNTVGLAISWVGMGAVMPVHQDNPLSWRYDNLRPRIGPDLAPADLVDSHLAYLREFNGPGFDEAMWTRLAEAQTRSEIDVL